MATTRRDDDGSSRRRRRRAGPAIAAVSCAIASLVGAPAEARDYPAQAIGGWTIAASKDGKGCFATRNYPRRGDTSLLFGLDLDGKNRLTVLNANWSIEPGERLKLDFALAGGRYPDHFAIGIAADGKQGFVSSFESRFAALFAGSDRLTIARGETPVERLDLDGSGAAVAGIRRCLATVAAPASDAGADDDIPADPFARKVTSGSRN